MRNRRRTFSRYNLNISGTLLPIDGSGTSTHSVVVRDLSLGGGLLVSNKPIPVGTVWCLRIDVPGQPPRELSFLVRNCHTADTGGYRIGCQKITSPAVLRAIGAQPEAITSEELALAAEGLRPTWDIEYNLIAKGGLSATVLTAISVMIAEDLTISEKLVDCTLDIAGRLVGPDATLIGGSANVLRGVTIGTLGGEDSRPTWIVLGASLKTSETLAAADRQLAARKASIEKKRGTVAALKAKVSTTLSHADRELLTVMMCELPELERQLAAFEANANKLRNREAGLRLIRLEVTKKIYPGVTIVAAGNQITFTQEVAGPVVLGLTPTGEFDFLGDTDSSPYKLAELATSVRHAA